MRRIYVAMLAFSTVLSAQEKVDLTVLNRIKAEAFQNSQVMDHLFYLADVYGPRLTNSPGHKAAGDFVVKRLQEYGLENVKEEKWGPEFGCAGARVRGSGGASHSFRLRRVGIQLVCVHNFYAVD